jgi:hypothetical protein
MLQLRGTVMHTKIRNTLSAKDRTIFNNSLGFCSGFGDVNSRDLKNCVILSMRSKKQYVMGLAAKMMKETEPIHEKLNKRK